MQKIHIQIDKPLQTCQRWQFSYRTYRRRIAAGLLPPPIGRGIPSGENSLLIAAANAGADDETLRRMVKEIVAARPSLAASSV
ncbi:hypothetical protein [Methylococcus capsulatus]|uniref:hypothetical protein n=1 Tax=Methylococcus capsulatus TaxID=414 RepID=UPI001C5300E2|nr:hypothetical protein [Methylococcus capsulatus]QXP90022.1 hypothetical protein KW114_13305 [Methylococcus capsulatus]